MRHPNSCKAMYVGADSRSNCTTILVAWVISYLCPRQLHNDGMGHAHRTGRLCKPPSMERKLALMMGTPASLRFQKCHDGAVGLKVEEEGRSREWEPLTSAKVVSDTRLLK